MKKFLIVLINFIILFLMLILILIMSIKSIAIDTVYKTNFTSEIKNYIQNEYPEIKNIDEKDMKNIIEKYIDVITLNKNIDLSNEINKILSNYDVSSSKKEEIISNINEHNDLIVKKINQEYSPTENQQILLDIYNYLNSKILKNILFSIIIFLFIIMIILQKSLYKWLLTIGIDFSIIGFLLLTILPELINKFGKIKIDIITLSDKGLKYSSIGIFLIMIYIIIDYIINLKNKTAKVK